jgi:hypothetical protein
MSCAPRCSRVLIPMILLTTFVDVDAPMGTIEVRRLFAISASDALPLP